jgi:phospholipid-binding lipoprotein MlaA
MGAMKTMLSRLGALPLAVAAAVGAGCANREDMLADEGEMQDPFQPVNRMTHSFNDGILEFMEPAARVYEDTTPEPARDCISNMFDNLEEPGKAVGHGIAGNAEMVGVSILRFGINTVVGGLGCLDLATDSANLLDEEMDVGLGLRARLGTERSLYLVLPVFGPSSAIDVAGDVIEDPVDPTTYESDRNPYYLSDDASKELAVGVVGAVHARYELLETTDLIDEIALDPYLFVREAYLESRVEAAAEIRDRPTHY